MSTLMATVIDDAIILEVMARAMDEYTGEKENLMKAFADSIRNGATVAVTLLEGDIEYEGIDEFFGPKDS